MVAKPDIPAIIKHLALAFFLLLSLFTYPQNDPSQSRIINASVDLKGLTGNKEGYYRNLMMQDIGLPQQWPLSQIRFGLDYSLEYYCKPAAEGKWELNVAPLGIHCQPVNYVGYDISEAIIPEYCKVTFNILNHYGYVEDSVVIQDIPFGRDPGFYVSKSFYSASPEPELQFESIVFEFTSRSYDHFRARVSSIDDYYAAAALLDSLKYWSGALFPSGINSVWGYYLQQLEISRIIHYVARSPGMELVDETGYDPAGLMPLLRSAQVLDTRSKTILQRMLSEGIDGIGSKPPAYWIKIYYKWILDYYSLITASDYRFSNFYTGLASLDISNAMISDQRGLILEVLAQTNDPEFYQGRIYLFLKELSAMFLKQAGIAKEKGETVRALELYGNAKGIRMQTPGLGDGSGIDIITRQLYQDLVDSYLGLARMAADRGNINMAEGYLNDARNIIAREELDPASEKLIQTEQQLFDQFLRRATQMLAEKKFRMTLDYMTFLFEKCSSGKYNCTGDIQRISREAGKGLYDQLLSQAANYLDQGEEGEARASLNEAIDLRYHSTGNIGRDSREYSLSARLNQIRYEENIEEGEKNLRYGNPDIALYYLNRARAMEQAPLLKREVLLGDLLKQAARPVILDMVRLGRARAMGYYFEEGWEVLSNSLKMTSDYDLQDDTSIHAGVSELNAMLRELQCEKLNRDFRELVQESRELKTSGEYVKAMQKVNKAVELSLDDTVCLISDQEAWYERAALEYPVEFEKRRDAALAMVPGDPAGFIKAYQNLELYYHEMDLGKEGVELVDGHSVVMQQDDIAFLEGMMSHYFSQQEKEHLVQVMKSLWEVHGYAPSRSRQSQYAEWLALSDMRSGCPDPLLCLNGYVPVDRSFKSFRYHYKLTWLKKSGWKFRYLSLFLRNNPTNNN